MRRVLPIIFFVLAIITSCTGNKVYDKYDHTPLQGWDKVDVLSFDVPAFKESGRYATTLGLRIDNAYPFQSLTLVVEQNVKNKTYIDTLNCSLYDNQGSVKGNGISYYQYHFQVSEREFQAGDSLHIVVRHDMRREIIPGISDVGISITKQR